MNYRHILSLFTCLFVAANVAAAPKEKPVTHVAAIAMANTINRMGTVDNYLKWLGKRLPAKDIESLKQEMSLYGITPDLKFPKMSYKDDKVFFDKKSTLVIGKEITVGGKRFSVQQRSIRDTFADICVQIKCVKVPGKSAAFSIFPKADASYGNDYNGNNGGGLFGNFNWGNALLGAVAGGALTCLFSGGINNNNNNNGYYSNNSNCQQNWWKGALVGGGIGGFINTENNYSCGGNCNVTCNGDDYYMSNYSQPYYDQGYGQNGSYSQSGRTRIYAGGITGAYPNQYQTQQYPPPCSQYPQYATELAQDYNSPNTGYTPWAQAPIPNYQDPGVPTFADPTRAAASEPKKEKAKGK